MVQPPPDPLPPSAATDQHVDYALRLLSYIQFFNANAENRANYLILANSIFLIGMTTLTAGATFEVIRGSVALLVLFIVATAGFFLSVAFAVVAILPRTFDDGTPLNHDVIPQRSKEQLVRELQEQTPPQIVHDVALEVHVLCRVVNTRFRYVRFSALWFFVGIVALMAGGSLKVVSMLPMWN